MRRLNFSMPSLSFIINKRVFKVADCINPGPEGGDDGGLVSFQGTPECKIKVTSWLLVYI